MMIFLKNNFKIIIAFMIGFILACGIVYAATSARDVSYTKEGINVNNVEEALNDLYTKTNAIAKNSLSIKASQTANIAWNDTKSDSISVSHVTTKKCNYICVATITNHYYALNPTSSVSGTLLDTPCLADSGNDSYLKIGYGTAEQGDTLTASVSGSTNESYCKLHCFILTDE